MTFRKIVIRLAAVAMAVLLGACSEAGNESAVSDTYDDEMVMVYSMDHTAGMHVDIRYVSGKLKRIDQIVPEDAVADEASMLSIIKRPLRRDVRRDDVMRTSDFEPDDTEAD